MSRWTELARLRLARIAAAALFGLVVGAILWAAPASAHAVLIGSDPVSGASLAVAPRVVTLRFSDILTPERSSVELVDMSGRPVAGATVRVDDARRQTMTVQLPNLAGGTYAVVWHAFTAWDAHTTNGVMVFSVGSSSPSQLGALAGDGGAAGLAWRWLNLVLLAAAVGSLVIAGPALRRVAPAGPYEPALSSSHTMRRLVLTFAASCCAATAVLGLLPFGLDDAWWPVRALAFASLAVVCIRLRREWDPTPSRRRWWIAGALLLVVGISLSLFVEPGVGVALAVASGLHVLSACAWFGTVAVLALIQLWSGVSRRWLAPAAAIIVQACRDQLLRPALVTVGIYVATGLYRAGHELNAASDIVRTAPGRELLAEGSLAWIALTLATANLVIGRRPRTWQRLLTSRRPPLARLAGHSIQIEAAVGLVALLLVGTVARVEPAPFAAAEAADSSTSVSGTVDDLPVSVVITPNQPGVNGFTVVAASRRRPALAPTDALLLDLGDSVSPPLRLQPIGPDRYFGAASLPASGLTRLSVVIERAGTELRVPLEWSVADPPQVQQFSSLLNQLAVLVVGAGLLMVLWWIVMARPRRPVGTSVAAGGSPGLEQEVIEAEIIS